MGAEFVELDEYRRKNNKSKTQEGEDRARELFLRKLSGNKWAVVEMTGSGKIFDEALKQCSDRVIIKLECDYSLIEKRIKKRCGILSRYQHPPFPSSWKGFTSSKADILQAAIWMKYKINTHDHIVEVDGKTPAQIVKEVLCYV